jgi:hypothetical protein
LPQAPRELGPASEIDDIITVFDDPEGRIDWHDIERGNQSHALGQQARHAGIGSGARALCGGLEEERQHFQRLMVCEDQDLFAWFLQREQPQDEELVAIVSKILEFARTPPDRRTV